jgi:hypothetical protein
MMYSLDFDMLYTVYLPLPLSYRCILNLAYTSLALFWKWLITSTLSNVDCVLLVGLKFNLSLSYAHTRALISTHSVTPPRATTSLYTKEKN